MEFSLISSNVLRHQCYRCFRHTQRVFSSKSSVYAKSSVDEKEVKHHEKMSQDWWDAAKGPVKALHAMNGVRVPFIRTGLINNKQLDESIASSKPEYFNGISIADVGCGGGILSIALARLGAKVVGIEPGKELVEQAEAASKREGVTERVTFITSSIEEHAASNRGVYDAVVASEVIEHVCDKEIFVESCLETLKPGGSIFFTTINRTPLAWALAIFGAEQLLRLVPVGTHDYDKLITPDELSSLLSRKNATTRMVNGYMYDPLTNRFYWQPSTAILYSLHAVKNL